MLTACAEGGESPTAQEKETTPGEVVSAEFPGGAAKVMEFIAGEVTYPEAAKADGVEGKVFVEFTIAETGAVTNVHVSSRFTLLWTVRPSPPPRPCRPGRPP